MKPPLIAPKHITEFTPEEYVAHANAMASHETKRKKASPAPGLSLFKTKKGLWSVRRGKTRPFAYVTKEEIVALAKDYSISQAELWNLFREKKWIISCDRLEAEQINENVSEIPF